MRKDKTMSKKDNSGASRPEKKRKKLDDGPLALSNDQKCNLIAELSETVLENPDSSFFSRKADEVEDSKDEFKQPSRVKRLIDMADTTTSIASEDGMTVTRTDAELDVARLAMVSLLAIFQDVLPSYRIRLPTSEEMAVRVAKETKRLWDYERALLTHYRWYLKVLERTWERDTSTTGLGITAVLALCELLKKAPHFNFRSDVLSVVARQCNHKRNDRVASACCDAVKQLFVKDTTQGEATLEATRILTKMVHNRNFQVRPELLETLLKLPLRVHTDEAEAAKLFQKNQNKKRKKDQKAEADAAIALDVKEGSARVNRVEVARFQSDTLQAVILTYFRILKTDPKENKAVIPLLPGALQGLAKFSHLVHFDTVLDLLKVLKQLLTKVDALPLEAALNAVLTAFQTLQGPGRELQIDQKEYVTPLYSQLTRIPSLDPRSTLPPIIRCLTLAFLKRREHSLVRVAGFVRQILSIVCLHSPTYIATPLLTFARQLLQRYSSATSTRLLQLLENESDDAVMGSINIGSGGIEDDEVAVDPEDSHPFASSAWELGLLRFHVDPGLRHHAVGCADNRVLQFPSEAPEKVMEHCLRDLDRGYVGCRVRCKRHPLSSNNNKKRGRNREQARFVKARKTNGYHLTGFTDEQIRGLTMRN